MQHAKDAAHQGYGYTHGGTRANCSRGSAEQSILEDCGEPSLKASNHMCAHTKVSRGRRCNGSMAQPQIRLPRQRGDVAFDDSLPKPQTFFKLPVRAGCVRARTCVPVQDGLHSAVSSVCAHASVCVYDYPPIPSNCWSGTGPSGVESGVPALGARKADSQLYTPSWDLTCLHVNPCSHVCTRSLASKCRCGGARGCYGSEWLCCAPPCPPSALGGVLSCTEAPLCCCVLSRQLWQSGCMHWRCCCGAAMKTWLTRCAGGVLVGMCAYVSSWGVCNGVVDPVQLRRRRCGAQHESGICELCYMLRCRD
eukprot:1157374-Pelagomonas_calceolata.AAC.10